MPDWVSGDAIEAGVIRTVGSTQCSGLKSLDEKRADEQARIALGKILSSQVTSQETSVLSDHDGVSNSQFRSQSSLFSQQLLKNATVYDRWADAENCVVYAAIRVSQQDIVAAEREQQAKQQRKLINQSICVSASGQGQRVLQQHLEAGLVQHGYQLALAGHQCSIKLNAKNQQTVARANQVLTELQISVVSANQVLWKKQYDGKGISFSPTSKQQLFQRALSDTVDSLMNDLETLKQQEVK
ncbi:hypothetical protein [Shewanella mangrovi]|nr:hypothetical protein [Shewanella mangrovi]